MKKQINIQSAKRAVLAITGLTEQQYIDLMYNSGLQFADYFARLMPDPLQTYDQLTKTVTQEGNNYYWQWWMYNWLLNDQEWYNNQVFKQAITYQQYKSYLIACEILTSQLLQDLSEGKILVTQ